MTTSKLSQNLNTSPEHSDLVNMTNKDHQDLDIELDSIFNDVFNLGQDIGKTARMLEADGWYGIKPELPNVISDKQKMEMAIKPHREKAKQAIKSLFQSQLQKAVREARIDERHKVIAEVENKARFYSMHRAKGQPKGTIARRQFQGSLDKIAHARDKQKLTTNQKGEK